MLPLLFLFGVIGYGAAQSWVAPKEVIVGDAPTSCTNSITDTHVAFSFVALLGTIQGRKWVLVTDGVTTVQVDLRSMGTPQRRSYGCQKQCHLGDKSDDPTQQHDNCWFINLPFIPPVRLIHTSGREWFPIWHPMWLIPHPWLAGVGSRCCRC